MVVEEYKLLNTNVKVHDDNVVNDANVQIEYINKVFIYLIEKNKKIFS